MKTTVLLALSLAAGTAAAGPTVLVTQQDQLYRYQDGTTETFTLADEIVALTGRSNGSILAVSRNPGAPGEAYDLIDPLGATPSLSLTIPSISPIAAPTYPEINGQLHSLEANTLFVVDNNTLARTGTVGSLGLTGTSASIGGGAFDAATQTLYAASFDGSLYTVDINTGAASLVGGFGVNAENAGLEVFNGELWAALQDPSALVTRVGTVDTATGAFTEVFSIDISAIGTGPTAIVVLPAPGAASLLAAGVFGVTRRRR